MAGKKRDVVVAGSGNVFKDLGFTDSEERKLRVQLAVRLNAPIDEQRLAQTAVAKRFGIPPKGDILDLLGGSGEECPPLPGRSVPAQRHSSPVRILCMVDTVAKHSNRGGGAD